MQKQSLLMHDEQKLNTIFMGYNRHTLSVTQIIPIVIRLRKLMYIFIDLRNIGTMLKNIFYSLAHTIIQYSIVA